jgi:hypothetical protein
VNILEKKQTNECNVSQDNIEENEFHTQLGAFEVPKKLCVCLHS